MIAAFARAARVLARAGSGGTTPPRAPGDSAARGRVHSRARCGTARRVDCCDAIGTATPAIDGYAEDYASLTFGLLELFQADGDPAWLQWADRAAVAAGRAVLGRDRRRLVQHDRRGPDRAAAAQGGLRRRRAVADGAGGAQPAGADAPEAGRRSHRSHQPVDRAVRHPAGRVSRGPCRWCWRRLSAKRPGISQLVIVEADGGAEGAAALRDVAAEHYRPFQVEVPVTPAHARTLAAALPLIEAMGPVEGQSAAYLCANFTCQAPVTSPEALLRRVRSSSTISGLIVVQAFRPADGLNS